MKNMKTALALILSSLTLAGMATAAAAFEKGADYLVMEEVDPDSYVGYGKDYPGSGDWDWPECESGQLLKGTIISSFDPATGYYCWYNGSNGNFTSKNNASAAFDGDTTTLFEPFEATERSWAGMILDQPYELTEARIMVRGRYLERMNGAAIQGSNDGKKWATVIYFGQSAECEDYHIITPEPLTDEDYYDAGYVDYSMYWVGSGSYQIYRYVNLAGKFGEVVEIELYGNPAPATEVTEELSFSAVNFFSGTIEETGVTSVSVDGSITGTVIGAGGIYKDNAANSYEKAWDNDSTTFFDPAAPGVSNWTGIKVDEPVALKEVRIMPRAEWLDRTNGAHVQGSHDGKVWITLAAFTAEDCADEQTWISKPVTLNKEFTMFRYVNDGTKHGEIVDVALFAADIEQVTPSPIASGECGDNLTWSFHDNGELVIEGEGDMWDWDYQNNAPWYDLRENIQKITIESGVTSVGDFAFDNCYKITSAELPNSVAVIGNSAFSNTALTDITIPNSVTQIECYAFDGCPNLKSVFIPKSVTEIEWGAFCRCRSLESITVDEGNPRYTNDARGVLFNKNKTTLLQYPVGKTDSSYAVPNGVTTIDLHAFEDASLSTVFLPDSLKLIDASAFSDCLNLTEITIPKEVSRLDHGAFEYCRNLKKATVLSRDVKINSGVFSNTAESFVLCGYADSTAEAYAAENGLTFVEIVEILPDDAAKEGVLSYGEITSAKYPASLTEGWPTCTTGQLLKGEIIAGIVGEQVARDGHTADLAFDGSPDTYYGSFEHTSRSYVGIVLDQAYVLTEIRARIANDVPSDNFHGLTVQGSNDGIHWENIVVFRQDATGNSYHIFTPQTVTDQRYIDAGYGARTDESPFWVGSGNSYKMYRVWTQACDLSLAEIEFYGNPAPATVLDDEAAAALIPTTTWYPGNINERNVTIESIDGSLVGTVVGAAGSWNKAFYENAFDGNNKKAYDPSFRGPENWVGLLLEEPHALKSFKVMPKRGTYSNLEGCLVQGSLDGRTWVTLCQLTKEDVPTRQVWIEKEVNDTNGYLYFRYVTSIRSHGDIADILFYGEPAAAAANIPAAEKYAVATYEKFLGTMVDTGIRSTSIDGSLVGTVMGYGDVWLLNKNNDSGYDLAFDGNFTTNVKFEKLGALNFTVLKLDAPTVITEAKLYPTSNLKGISGTHMQGSVDGINWVDLAVFTDADIPAVQKWVSKTVTDTTAYNYVRYAPSAYSGAEMAEAAFIGEAKDSSALPGDITDDGSLDIRDAIALFRYSMMPDLYPVTYSGNMDFNKDCFVNITDVVSLFRHSMMPDLYPLEEEGVYADFFDGLVQKVFFESYINGLSYFSSPAHLPFPLIFEFTHTYAQTYGVDLTEYREYKEFEWLYIDRIPADVFDTLTERMWGMTFSYTDSRYYDAETNTLVYETIGGMGGFPTTKEFDSYTVNGNEFTVYIKCWNTTTQKPQSGVEGVDWYYEFFMGEDLYYVFEGFDQIKAALVNGYIQIQSYTN